MVTTPWISSLPLQFNYSTTYVGNFGFFMDNLISKCISQINSKYWLFHRSMRDFQLMD